MSACVPVINNCANYKLQGVSLVCKLVSQADQRYACSQCYIRYLNDSDGKCNLCETFYDKDSEDPFTCARRIENCLSYQKFNFKYIKIKY